MCVWTGSSLPPLRGGEWFTAQHTGDGWERGGHLVYGGNYSDTEAFTADKEQRGGGELFFAPDNSFIKSDGFLVANPVSVFPVLEIETGCAH